MSMMKDITEFYHKFGMQYGDKPRDLPPDLSDFRIQFLYEEVDEYTIAARDMKQEDQLDALVDIVYVAIGTAYLQGFDFEEAWNRVHEANMKKVKATDENSNTGRESTYDLAKPEGWKPPDLSNLVTGDNDDNS